MNIIPGKEALIELLSNEGVEYIFGIPGATEILFMDALEQAEDIKYILGLNEIVCAGMAEGYARASGKPGFLNLHTGPGIAAALPMLYNAYFGQVPLVITVGQQDGRLLQYDPHLSGDIVGMGKLYTKWCTEIRYAEDIPVTIQRAFKMAIQYPTGPVLVSLPQNVLEQEFEFQYKPNTKIFTEQRPDKAALERAINMIKGIRNPIVLVESGVARCNALNEIVRFAELIGAKVYQGWMSDVNFPVTHPQYLGDLDPTSSPATEVFESADMLIGVGCPMFAQGFYNPNAPSINHLKIIQFDENPWEIGKNFPVDCGVQGDIKASLAELNDMLEADMSAEVRREVAVRIKDVSSQKYQQTNRLIKQIESEKDRQPLSISRLMADLKKVVTPDTVIVDDCWSSSAMLRQVLDLTEPNTFFRARKGGSIGSGLPMSLGVKLGLPEKKVISVSGDGSAAWSLQSFWTAARYNIPVTFVITNNATYRQVKMTRRIILGDYPLTEKHDGMELEDPVLDFCMLAESMGVKGIKVEKPDQLLPALESSTRSETAALVEVFVENTP
jgi:benzoylformate decarboxylase